MPATYRLDLADRVVWSRAWGVVTDEELDAHSRASRSDLRFEPGLRQFQDLADITDPRVTPGGLHLLAQVNPFVKPARRAVLVASDVVFGLARMHEQLRGDAGDDLQVFRDRAAPLAWLGLPDDWTPPEAAPTDPVFQSAAPK